LCISPDASITDVTGRSARAAENIPGVKAVEDHLVWVDPLSGIAIHAFEEVAEREPPAT